MTAILFGSAASHIFTVLQNPNGHLFGRPFELFDTEPNRSHDLFFNLFAHLIYLLLMPN